MFFLSDLGSLKELFWVGIVQGNPQDTSIKRDYKWLRSDDNIPNSGEIWANRYVPYKRDTACGQILPHSENSKLHDNYCTQKVGFICEWWSSVWDKNFSMLTDNYEKSQIVRIKKSSTFGHQDLFATTSSIEWLKITLRILC